MVGIVTTKVKVLEIFLTNEIGLKINLISKTAAVHRMTGQQKFGENIMIHVITNKLSS